MPKLTGTFSADGAMSLELLIQPKQDYYLSLTASPSLTGRIELQARTLSTSTYTVLRTFTATQAGTTYTHTGDTPMAIRLVCNDLDAGTETVAYVLQSLISTGRRVLVDHRPKVGATSGWVINAANNLGLMATLPASRTTNTLVIPINNLEVGNRILGFYPVGQVESAGNDVTLTVELRRITAAAADVVDASVATTGAVTVAADTVLNNIVSFAELNELVQDGTSYYFLVTGTTAASTDIALMGVKIQFENGY